MKYFNHASNATLRLMKRHQWIDRDINFPCLKPGIWVRRSLSKEDSPHTWLPYYAISANMQGLSQESHPFHEMIFEYNAACHSQIRGDHCAQQTVGIYERPRNNGNSRLSSEMPDITLDKSVIFPREHCLRGNASEFVASTTAKERQKYPV